MQKTIFFDLDGTLTPQSTWFLLNQRLGITAEEDHQLFLDYIHEKFAYKDWMDALMKLYKRGPLVSKEELIAFAQNIELRPEAQMVINVAKEKGYTVAIISGSVDIIVETVAKKLDIETWFAKTAAVFDDSNNLIDVSTHGDGERDEKFHILQTYCVEHTLDISEVICVEDGGNGLELFKHAKGILLGDNKELAPLAWKQIQSLSEVVDIL